MVFHMSLYKIWDFYFQLFSKMDINKSKKPVDLECNSNMHMYYAFANHIYSFSPMTTYVFC